MIVVTCPATDSDPHEVFSTACKCGCDVEFEEGNMLIHHQPFDESMVEKWAIFEELELP